jgi:hypothetical protein
MVQGASAAQLSVHIAARYVRPTRPRELPSEHAAAPSLEASHQNEDAVSVLHPLGRSASRPRRDPRRTSWRASHRARNPRRIEPEIRVASSQKSASHRALRSGSKPYTPALRPLPESQRARPLFSLGGIRAVPVGAGVHAPYLDGDEIALGQSARAGRGPNDAPAIPPRCARAAPTRCPRCPRCPSCPRCHG